MFAAASLRIQSFCKFLQRFLKLWWIGCLSMQVQSKIHLGSIKLIQS
jgi:hypothetical protein